MTPEERAKRCIALELIAEDCLAEEFRAAIAEEREACLKIAADRARANREALTDPAARNYDGVVLNAFILEADMIAAAMRARA